MQAWLWIGHSYVAASVRPPSAKALVTSPREARTSSRTTGVARISAYSRACSGRPVPGDQVALSALAARTASHSRSAQTPRKLPIRTTRTPGMEARDASSTARSVAPTAGGRIARP